MAFDEYDLICRSQKGDIDAFEQLISAYQQKIYNTAYRMMGNYHDASDVAQEAIIKVYKALSGFRREASFGTWVYHITANTCRDEIRRQYRAHESSLDECILTDSGEITKEIADCSHMPEQVLGEKEVEEYLQTLINALNPEYRMVMVLREQLGLSYQEIADSLDISMGTVKSRINRGRRALREKILADKEHYPDLMRLVVRGGEKA